jgi:hypothetical protein
VGECVTVFVGKLLAFFEDVLEDGKGFGIPLKTNGRSCVYGEIIRMGKPVAILRYSLGSSFWSSLGSSRFW